MPSIPIEKREWANRLVDEFNTNNTALGCRMAIVTYDGANDWYFSTAKDGVNLATTLKSYGYYQAKPKSKEDEWETIILQLVWDTCLFLWSQHYKKVIPPKECIRVMKR
jgi:hypothetical protein